MTGRISVIIPVYNEERTISSILEILLSWGKACEIILINDGSVDRTLRAIKQFSSQIKIITYKKNRGKGYALTRGIEESTGDILLFIDGDLIGLTYKALNVVVNPLIHDSADMTIGVRMLPRYSKIDIFKILGGERALKRAYIISNLPRIKKSGYGVELILNEMYKKKRVRYVTIPYVTHLIKYEKQNFPEAMVSYIKEAKDLIAQVVKQQAGEVTPQAKKIYTIVITYLKQALDYFQ